MNQSLAKTGALTSLAGGAVLALGAFMPWATLGVFSKAGIDGDGVLTAAAGGGIALLAIIMLANPGRALPVVAFLAAMGAIGIIYYDMWDIYTSVVHIGSGLYVSWLGVTAAGIGAALHFAALHE